MSDTAPEFSLTCREPEPNRSCSSDVHGWFELSYSSYLVLLRSLMQEMPPAWQHAMVHLLERMREEFPEERSVYTVLKKGEHNRFEKDPLRNYRYPDDRAIAAARGEGLCEHRNLGWCGSCDALRERGMLG